MNKRASQFADRSFDLTAAAAVMAEDFPVTFSVILSGHNRQRLRGGRRVVMCRCGAARDGAQGGKGLQRPFIYERPHKNARDDFPL
jgi:hypothetical protein